jgi:EAL domain-containing protein (putative c-di-GMP-specific phosphodiesterase class I)
MMKTVTKDAEAKLVEYTEVIEPESNSWRALHFHFARLLEHYKSDYQVKIATNLIADLLKEAEGSLFLCADCDIFVAAKGVNKSLLDKVVFQLRYLFMDDPLAYNADGQENADFCTLYDLSVDWKEYVKTCRKKLGASAISEAEHLNASQDLPAPASSGKYQAGAAASAAANRAIKPMTPARLMSVEKDLRTADLSRVIRRQPICAAPPRKQIRRVYDELYINISHLRHLIMADVDFMSNRSLFRYLTELLDEKVLDLLRRNGRYFEMPVSLNLNVATLLSEKFTQFDNSIKPSTKVSIVIELQLADVFMDMEAFLYAKSAVQKQGYRICLDGLTTDSFLQVSREGLGFDLAKLQWNADAPSDLDSPENKALAEAVKRCGGNRVILNRCDTRQAVDYGHAMGISLFQGRFLDKVINPDSKVEN